MDSAANAQKGIALELDAETLAQLERSDPGPCSDERVALLVRLATLNKILRRKHINVDKLYRQPVLFTDDLDLLEKPEGADGHILKAATGRFKDALR